MSFAPFVSCDHMDLSYLTKLPTQAYNGTIQYKCVVCDAPVNVKAGDISKFKNNGNVSNSSLTGNDIPNIAPVCSCLSCSSVKKHLGFLPAAGPTLKRADFNAEPLDTRADNFSNANITNFSLSQDLRNEFKQMKDCNCVNCIIKNKKLAKLT